MGSRIDSYVNQTAGLVNFNGGGFQYVVQTPSGVLYMFFVDNSSDLSWKKSTDGGRTWSYAATIFTGTLTQLSIWYDRWSGINADLIHLAWTESAGGDTLYRNLDPASSDALSTQTTINNGGSTAAGGSMSITRTRGGNLLCRGCIDAGVEFFFARSTDAGATWTSRSTTGTTAAATTDQYLMVPGFAADNQDAMCFFWDASANTIFKQVYDDSGDSWTESTLSASMSDRVPANHFPHWAAAVDLTNSKIVLIAWNDVDIANSDLKCWTIDESTDTAKTDVVTNSTDDQGLAAIGIETNTGWWFAFYAGATDGSETAFTDVHVYGKVSKDQGSTWSSETRYTTQIGNTRQVYTIPRFTGGEIFAFHTTNAASAFSEMRVNTLARGFGAMPGSLHEIESGVAA